MKRVFCLIFVCLMTFLLVGCVSEDGTAEPTQEGDGSETVTESATFSVKTPYCILKYPEKWRESVSVDTRDEGVCTVSFSADGHPLFDVLLNCDGSEILGTLQTDRGEVALRVNSYSLDPGSEGYNDYCAMQDDVNILLAHLKNDYAFSEGDSLSVGSGTVYGIETSVVTLSYPERWRSRVKVEVTDVSVFFSADGVRLFDLHFGGEDGDLIGTYNGMPITVVLYDIDRANLSDEIYGDLIAMQEDVNVIIEYLTKDPGFKIKVG